jgi:hypothetical protein
MVFAVNIPLNRTFSVFQHSGEVSEVASDYRLWLFRRNNSGLSWNDLLEKCVVVILGEMGSGKTFEFQHQTIRLKQEDKAAFFLPLNQITSRESAQAVLDDQRPRFEKWCRSSDVFFRRFLGENMHICRLSIPGVCTALR